MILRFLSYFNHRLYMSIYTYILKLWKMNISGKPRYIGISTWFDDFDMITLGNRVVISDNCYFLTHDYSITTVMIAMGLEVPHDIAINKGIILGDNVFIGKNSMILPGTEIGNNVIIGAMSVTSTPSSALHTCIGQQKLKVFPANKSKTFLFLYK